MNRQEFMEELKRGLQGISEEESEDAVNYYEEYFEEAGSENEAEVIKELGNPIQIAKRIKAEVTIKQVKDEEVKSSKQIKGILSSMGLILGVLFASPLLIPMGLTGVIAMGTILLLILTVVGSVIVGGISIAVTGVIVIFVGIYVLFLEPLTGVFLIGASSAIIGLDILIAYGLMGIAKKLIKVSANIGSKIIDQLGKGEK